MTDPATASTVFQTAYRAVLKRNLFGGSKLTPEQKAKREVDRIERSLEAGKQPIHGGKAIPRRQVRRPYEPRSLVYTDEAKIWLAAELVKAKERLAAFRPVAAPVPGVPGMPTAPPVPVVPGSPVGSPVPGVSGMPLPPTLPRVPPLRLPTAEQLQGLGRFGLRRILPVVFVGEMIGIIAASEKDYLAMARQWFVGPAPKPAAPTAKPAPKPAAPTATPGRIGKAKTLVVRTVEQPEIFARAVPLSPRPPTPSVPGIPPTQITASAADLERLASRSAQQTAQAIKSAQPAATVPGLTLGNAGFVASAIASSLAQGKARVQTLQLVYPIAGLVGSDLPTQAATQLASTIGTGSTIGTRTGAETCYTVCRSRNQKKKKKKKDRKVCIDKGTLTKFVKSTIKGK